MTKCAICNERPAKVEGFCNNCFNKIEAERQKRKPEQPKHYLVYRGNVVGLFPNGGNTLKARLLKKSVKYLPKCRTINLDSYCEGFNRQQIKRFKACVLKLAQA